MIGSLGQLFAGWRSQRFVRRSRHRSALERIPPELYDHWRRTAGKEFPDIPGGRLFFTRAAEGLMDFFECARRGGQLCALPSDAADSVWHAWSQLSANGLDRFCVENFGRSIPHVDGAAMGEGRDAALAICLVRARRLDSMPAAVPRLPRLFRLDAQLRMPGGFRYMVDGQQIAWHRLDRYGKPYGTMYTAAALAPLALLNAGLVSHEEYQEHQRREGASNNDGGGSSGGSADGGRDCDSASDSGGGDAGSSCGGGCGGGGGD